MNHKVYILAIASFVVGTVELILGGILDLIASSFQVSIAKAGYLISIFSLVYAISAPVLLNITAKFERKKVYLWALFIFLLSNIVALASTGYSMLMVSRILAAMSGSFIIVLSTTMASRLVKPEYQGRALGIVFMGISASLVLGIPIGIFIGNAFGWREVFILIALLTAIIMVIVAISMERLEPAPVVPIKQQLNALRNTKMLSIHIATFFVLAGHLTLYAYFTPFLQETFGLSSGMVTLVYGIFGLAAVAGGGFGGVLSDKLGAPTAVIGIIGAFFLSMVALPFAVKLPFILFLIVMTVWSALSWAVSPAQNNLIIQSAKDNPDVLISTNVAISHLGIAAGSYVGGIIINGYSSLFNGWVGSILVLLGLLATVIAVTRPSISTNSIQSK
ncbi:MFS transporter [Priestia flexa]|jgi:MFS transporter, DHA1 family, purine base/nucleoside efflux pump|uniref:MFS transporter n=1 Tax=Priestia veravalensis TaxID=1414648 RepID=A0A0V8JQP8_9BACI|nr:MULTISPECIES: MFS transporter [Bacillaceae]AQX54917.1 MFS transporter [Priestia flexa]KSU89395.1 MFS transporter [Priestia veravalensis]KZB92925.1 MFS transporter [Bacillus sp. VT 712]MBN8434391.1 MFS transporter [Priestia flexa]MCA0966825.1 MFS transporter [Priestia flexa]